MKDRGIGIFGVAVFAIRFCGFGVHCGLRIFRFLAFGFRILVKNTDGFSNFLSVVVLGFFLFGSRFLLSLFNLSGNYAPPLISNNLCMLPCHHCIALIRILVTRVKYIEIDRFARGFRFCSIFFRFSYLDDFFLRLCGF